MRKIQMVDLQSQYLRLQAQIDSQISAVIQSAAFINGPQVKSFERNLSSYLNCKHVIACANGTDALQIAFMALKLPKGSEIITPSFSYAALAEVIHLLELVPVFVEVNPNTYLMDEKEIEKAITSKTKAIAPVHLYGQCANMEHILTLAKNHDLYVIEDTAQAIGARYTFSNAENRFAGTMGNIGTTSFFPSKNLGCYGDGGAIFTNDDDLAETIRMICNHGQKQKYMHQIVGVNSRLDTIQAGVLEAKLPHLLDFEMKRNAVATHYDSELGKISEITIPARVMNSTHVFHQYTIQLKSENLRNELKKYLDEKNIPTMIYYPIPLHKQHAYKQDISLTGTEDLCARVLSLPISTEMDEEQLLFITNNIKSFFN